MIYCFLANRKRLMIKLMVKMCIGKAYYSLFTDTLKMEIIYVCILKRFIRVALLVLVGLKRLTTKK